jgi:TonB family protein
MTRVLLYQPGHRWSVGLAFGAALLIHLAAVAIANVHHSGHAEPSGFPGDFTDITFEPPPLIAVTDADLTDPVPAPPQIDQLFQDESPTRPPIRRVIRKSITPFVRTKGASSTAPFTTTSARSLAINAPRPEYPYEARRQKITGDGLVGMRVDPASGEVRDVSMLKSTGSPFLDNAALSGFRKWRFKPGTASSVKCPVTFTLTGASF